MKFVCENEKQLADKVWPLLQDKLTAGFRVGLIGDLGAGKTTLVKMILQKLGVKEAVTSPTFTLRKIYETKVGLKIQHIDLYRHQKGQKSAEISEWLEDPDYLSFVEWPENLSEFKAKYNLLIFLKITGDNTREVEIKWN